MAYLAYALRDTAPTFAARVHMVAATVFWLAITYLVLGVALRRATTTAIRGLRTRLGVAVFLGYLLAHYFAYALALALIVRAVAGWRSYPDVTSIAVFTPLYASPSKALDMLSPLLNLALSPQLVIWIKGFVFPMTPFSIATGLIVSIIVLAVITAALRLGESLPKGVRRIVVAAPVIGVTAGATCCATLPLYIASSIPAIAYTLLASPVAPAIAYTAYFLFPPATTAALAHLFRSVEKCALNSLRNNPSHGQHRDQRHNAGHQQTS